MAIEKADVVIVGMGAVGGILAAELGKAGMKVIGLERGPRLKTADFQLDELRYFQRQELRPDTKRAPVMLPWENANALAIATSTSVASMALPVSMASPRSSALQRRRFSNCAMYA